jgi:hypothetical protein
MQTKNNYYFESCQATNDRRMSAPIVLNFFAVLVAGVAGGDLFNS